MEVGGQGDVVTLLELKEKVGFAIVERRNNDSGDVAARSQEGK